MAHISPIQADALFGVFLQDVYLIRKKYPQTFKDRYFLFEYAEILGDGYELSFHPDDVPKRVRNEIRRAFDLRLNREKATTRVTKTSLKHASLLH